jgi:hypothetical protein
VGTDIFVFGGSINRISQASVLKYGTVADEWSTLAPMRQPSVYHTASVLHGLVYIVGAGDTGREALRFDLALGAWSTLAPSLIDRRFGTSFVVDGCLHAAGGVGINSSVERYDVASDTWAAVPNMLEGRFGFCAVTIASTAPSKATMQ